MSDSLKAAPHRSPTLQRLAEHAASIIASGGPKSSDDHQVLRIFNSLNEGKNGRAGKRTKKNHNRNW